MPFNHYRTEPKYKELDDRPGSTHSLVLDLIEPGARVLEFGCATGYMSQALRDRYGATVIVGADTILGPLFFAYGRAEGGRDRFYVTLGRSL